MNDKFSLEDALSELETIVKQLENGEGSLDEAMALFEKGQNLIKQCQQDLDTKELTLQTILKNQQTETSQLQSSQS